MAVIFGFRTRSLPNSESAVTQLTSKCAADTAFKKDSSQGHWSGFFSKRTGDTFFPDPFPPVEREKSSSPAGTWPPRR